MDSPPLTDIEDSTLAMAEGDYVSFNIASAVIGAWYSRPVTYAGLHSITGRLSRLGLVRWRIRDGKKTRFRNHAELAEQLASTAEFTATAAGLSYLEKYGFMPETETANAFVNDIRSDLAAFAARTDDLMSLLGHGSAEAHDMPHVWLETAANITNEDVSARSEADVVSQLNYMAAAFRRGDQVLSTILAWTYIEGLLCNIRDPNLRKWAWNLFPEEVREHYNHVWGQFRP